jgi:hypothetical protein
LGRDPRGSRVTNAHRTTGATAGHRQSH